MRRLPRRPFLPHACPRLRPGAAIPTMQVGLAAGVNRLPQRLGGAEPVAVGHRFSQLNIPETDEEGLASRRDAHGSFVSRDSVRSTASKTSSKYSTSTRSSTILRGLPGTFSRWQPAHCLLPGFESRHREARGSCPGIGVVTLTDDLSDGELTHVFRTFLSDATGTRNLSDIHMAIVRIKGLSTS